MARQLLFTTFKNLFAALTALVIFFVFGNSFGGKIISRFVPIAFLGVMALAAGVAAVIVGRGDFGAGDFPAGSGGGGAGRRRFLTMFLSAGSMIVIWLALHNWPRVRVEATILAGVMLTVFFISAFMKHPVGEERA